MEFLLKPFDCLEELSFLDQGLSLPHLLFDQVLLLTRRWGCEGNDQGFRKDPGFETDLFQPLFCLRIRKGGPIREGKSFQTGQAMHQIACFLTDHVFCPLVRVLPWKSRPLIRTGSDPSRK